MKILKSPVLYVAIAALVFLFFTRTNGDYKVKSGAIGLDVRELSEVKENPSPGSLNIPLGEVKNNIENSIKDKNTQVLVFCESGRRAGMAKVMLQTMGYTNVVNVGSWRDWNDLKKANESSLQIQNSN